MTCDWVLVFRALMAFGKLMIVSWRLLAIRANVSPPFAFKLKG